MSILIDGYNLLNATDVFVRPGGPRAFERLRRALLDMLADSLPAELVSRTTIVFDAQNAPGNAPQSYRYRGIRVEFAVGYRDADAMIAELVSLDSAPRKMVVVSSDHQVQVSARRRGATAIDSEIWYAQLIQQRNRPPPQAPGKPEPQGEATDPEYWIQQFNGAIHEIEEELAAETARREEPRDDAPDKPVGEIYNPFPPGYAEDLLDDEE